MLFLFELAKEYGDLPQHEVISVLKAEQIVFDIVVSTDEVVVVEILEGVDKISNVAHRLALCFCIDELFFSCDPNIEELEKKVRAVDLKGKGTVAVHAKNRSSTYDTRKIVRVVASYCTQNRMVDLENPDVDIRMVICDDQWYVGRKVCGISRTVFENRRAHHRPFFSPISLHPKLARSLVNLSQVRNGGRLLDPFCGTGGILIEAGMVGARVYGNDIEKKMIDGCFDTLKHFGIDEYSLIVGDVEAVDTLVDSVDAIVTDLPYGKSTTTRGESLEDLYHRAFKAFSSVLSKDGVVVAGGSLSSIGDIAGKFLSVVKVYPIRVHRSLTRYFVYCHH